MFCTTCYEFFYNVIIFVHKCFCKEICPVSRGIIKNICIFVNLNWKKIHIIKPWKFNSLIKWILGLVNGRGWFTVLFPSVHTPPRDGLSWDSVHSCSIDWTYGPFKKSSDWRDSVHISCTQYTCYISKTFKRFS